MGWSDLTCLRPVRALCWDQPLMFVYVCLTFVVLGNLCVTKHGTGSGWIPKFVVSSASSRLTYCERIVSPLCFWVMRFEFRKVRFKINCPLSFHTIRSRLFFRCLPKETRQFCDLSRPYLRVTSVILLPFPPWGGGPWNVSFDMRPSTDVTTIPICILFVDWPPRGLLCLTVDTSCFVSGVEQCRVRVYMFETLAVHSEHTYGPLYWHKVTSRWIDWTVLTHWTPLNEISWHHEDLTNPLNSKTV